MNILPDDNSFVQKITVKSAVNASLWACFVVSIPLFILATKVIGWLQGAFFFVGVIPVVSFAFSYIYLIIKNPDYLRSEEYQIKATSLKLLGDKDNPLHAKATDIVSVSVPGLPPPNQQNQDE